jgi:hypothetical protein
VRLDWNLLNLSTLSTVIDDPRLKQLAQSLQLATAGGDDFIRFQPDDGDDHVGALVQSSEFFEDTARADLRTLLTSDAKDTLYLFAQRRVVLGLRTSNVSYFHQALSAFSLLPTVDDIPWTTWFLAAIFLGGYANDTDLVTLFEGPTTAGGKRCQILQKSLKNGGSLAQCHFVEVNTTYGKGLVELPLPHDARARSGPFIDRYEVVYAPTTNLAQVAVDVADHLDHLEGTRTTPLEYSQLSTAEVPFAHTVGCLHCCATTEDSTFHVYVAELVSDAEATELVTGLSNDEGVAVSNGADVILFLAQPNFDDDAEPAPLETKPLEELARSALSRS